MARWVASAFGPRGARERVIFRRRPPLGERALHEHVDHATVLGVHADGAAVLARSQQRPEDARVVQHEHAGVRHEQLERRDALPDERVHLALDLIVHLRDDHVEAVVDGRLPSAFFIHVSHAWCSVWPRYWMAKSMIDVVPPKAAAIVPDSKSSADVVPPNGMSRCVCDVEPARNDVPARGVDDLVGGDVERRADDDDRLVFDEHVAAIEVGRGDDGAVADECAHGMGPRVATATPGLRGPAGGAGAKA